MKKLIALVLCIGLFSFSSFAENLKNFSKWSNTVASAEVMLALSPVEVTRTIDYLQATTDLTTEHVDFLTIAATFDATHILDVATAAGATTIPLASTTGLTTGDYFVIHNRSTDRCEMRRVAVVNAGVSITTVTALTYAYAVGDKVYEMEVNGILDNNGNTANQGSEYWETAGIWSGERARPIGIKIGVTTAGNLLVHGFLNVN